MLIAVAIVASMLGSRPAGADDGTAIERAQKFFEVGQLHFSAKEYELAVSNYRKAYEQEPLAEFLFNLGQAYRLWGKYELSAQWYQKYLDQVSTGLIADAARGHLPEMKRLAEAAHPARPEPEPEVTKPLPVVTGSRPLRLTSYALAGVGVVALGTGIAFGVRASNLSDELSNVDDWTQSNIDKIDSGENAETLSIILVSTGAVLLGAGVVLYFVSRDSEPAEQPFVVSPIVGNREVGLSLTGSF